MYVFHGTERLLPELELDGSVELGEAGIEMVLQSIGVGEVNGMGLVCVLGDIREVQAESLAKATELDLALMLQAELESLLGDLLQN